jgi:hypothetical protein
VPRVHLPAQTHGAGRYITWVGRCIIHGRTPSGVLCSI